MKKKNNIKETDLELRFALNENITSVSSFSQSVMRVRSELDDNYSYLEIAIQIADEIGIDVENIKMFLSPILIECIHQEALMNGLLKREEIPSSSILKFL